MMGWGREPVLPGAGSCMGGIFGEKFLEPDEIIGGIVVVG